MTQQPVKNMMITLSNGMAHVMHDRIEISEERGYKENNKQYQNTNP